MTNTMSVDTMSVDTMSVDTIMAYEAGELSADATIELFANLVRTGLAWSLQGGYGRAAQGLIDGGYIDGEGNVL